MGDSVSHFCHILPWRKREGGGYCRKQPNVRKSGQLSQIHSNRVPPQNHLSALYIPELNFLLRSETLYSGPISSRSTPERVPPSQTNLTSAGCGRDGPWVTSNLAWMEVTAGERGEGKESVCVCSIPTYLPIDSSLYSSHTLTKSVRVC